MEITEFEALSFDCYGTLIDWESGLAAVLRPWAISRGLALDDEALLTGVEDLESNSHSENESVHLSDLRKCCVNEAMLFAHLAASA